MIFTATDECGNASTTEATFTIEDTTAPSLVSPATSLELECSADQQAQIEAWLASNGGASATEDCGEITWTNNYVPSSENTACGATGTIDITFTATDDCGLSVETIASLSISDTTPPTIDTASSNELSLIHI